MTPTTAGGPVAGRQGSDGGAPLVGLIMGSDSDWRVMSAAGDLLDEFEVGYEVGVISAHRTPRPSYPPRAVFRTTGQP